MRKEVFQVLLFYRNFLNQILCQRKMKGDETFCRAYGVCLYLFRPLVCQEEVKLYVKRGSKQRNTWRGAMLK